MLRSHITSKLHVHMYVCAVSASENCCRFRTEAMFEPRIETRFRAYFLRIAYAVKPRSAAHLPSLALPPPPRPPRLTCRTFVPRRTAGATVAAYESLQSVQQRVWQELSQISEYRAAS